MQNNLAVSVIQKVLSEVLENVDGNSGAGSVISQILKAVGDFTSNSGVTQDEDAEDSGGWELGDISSLILKSVPSDRLVNVQSRLFDELPSDAVKDIQNIVLASLPITRIVQIIAEEVTTE